MKKGNLIPEILICTLISDRQRAIYPGGNDTLSTPRRGPSQSSSCMCLGPRSYRTDSAPVSLSPSLPLPSSPPPSTLSSLSPPPALHPSIRTLNEGCNAENALAFNNQEAFSSQQLLSSQGCQPISHTICFCIPPLDCYG